MTLEGTVDATVTDDAVEFAFAVTNTTDERVDLRFSTSNRIDVAVIDEGREVWRYTEGRMFAQVIGEESLEAGESRTYEAEWSDPQSGSFTAVAELRAQNRTCEGRTEFSVP